MTGGNGLRIAPMRGCLHSGEKAGLCQHGDPRAERHDAGTSGNRSLQRYGKRAGNGSVNRAPAGHDDQVRLFQHIDAAIRRNRQPARCLERSRLDSRNGVAVPAFAHFRTRQAENFIGDAEFEGAKPVIGKNSDERS